MTTMALSHFKAGCIEQMHSLVKPIKRAEYIRIQGFSKSRR
jgi:hypothetical protein